MRCLLGSSQRILIRCDKWTMLVVQRQRATPTSHKCIVAYKRDHRIIDREIRCTSFAMTFAPSRRDVGSYELRDASPAARAQTRIAL
jgi:hypothetical protein